MKRVAATVLLLACAAGQAGAHTRSVSHSRWVVAADGAISAEARVAQRDLAVRGIADAAAYVPGRLVLFAAGVACETEDVRPLASAEGWLRLAWRVVCAAPPDRLENRLFVDGVGARLHFARVMRAGVAPGEYLFGPSDVSRALDAGAEASGSEPARASFAEYVALGIEHIVTGWDHLAFLAGLLVLAGRLGDVVILATSFTVAHSVTLALAVLGIARPDGGAVEALIGFSILLIAVENVWLASGRGWALPVAAVGVLGVMLLARAGGVGVVSGPTLAGLAVFTAAHFGLLAVGRHPARLRAAVAFGFGLVHGFGFAGILEDAALPRDALVPALVGFNFGVELGQLGAIVLAWPVLVWLRRRAADGGLVVESISAALAALGTFWFVGRTFGAGG